MSKSGVSQHSEHVVDTLNAEKLARGKDLHDFNKHLIIMARQLHQSVSKITRLVECSWSAVVYLLRMVQRGKEYDLPIDSRVAETHQCRI